MASTIEQTSTAALIYNLRHRLNLSQEEFAMRLGVSVRTVNRWENQHSIPSKMAQRLLKDLLKQLDRPLAGQDSPSSL